MEVCVTGGTGFIASHLVHTLLLKGYRVRTTVRNPEDTSKIAFLWGFPGAKDRLRIFKADLLEEGSFCEALEGVQGVFHVASPVFVTNWESPEKSFLEPCLRGTINILNSCSNSASSVKRVVLTSSCSAIRYDYHRQETDPPLDESVWSNLDYCKQYENWYAWAKTIAEQTAWKISREKALDLVVVNPSFVVGPTLSTTPSSTIALILSLLKGDLKTYPNNKLGFVHVDDVVLAHVLAFEDPLASGRLICSEKVYHWQDIITMLKKNYPMYPIPLICGNEQGNAFPHKMNTTKLQKLGVYSFKSLEEMFDDCIKSLIMHGLLH